MVPMHHAHTHRDVEREGEMRCVVLLTLLLLSGWSAGGCTLSDGTHIDTLACTDD